MIDGSRALRRLFVRPGIIRLVGAHNALGAKMAERCGFDGVWSSSFEISASYAVPDASVISMSEHLAVARAMCMAVSVPVISDCDTGYGDGLQFGHAVRQFEAAGVAGVCIEDKQFPKANSFSSESQALVSCDSFIEKLRAGKRAQQRQDFVIIARVEALISGCGRKEALRRASAYAEAGADAVLIHSKQPTLDELADVVCQWRSSTPLVAVPTSYYQADTTQLESLGIKMVVYANHGLRCALQAMEQVYSEILESGSTASVEKRLWSMKSILELQATADTKVGVIPRDTADEAREAIKLGIDGREPRAITHQSTCPDDQHKLQGNGINERRLNILVMGKLVKETLHRLSANHHTYVVNEAGQIPPASVLDGADLVIVRSPYQITGHFIQKAPRLRWIIRAGAGTDNIDTGAAAERGIPVFTASLSATAVAELAFGLLLAITRQIPQLDRSLRRGEWRKNEAQGTELANKTIAIVGFGKIGRKVARIAQGYDMQILICDRSPEKPEKQMLLRHLRQPKICPLDEALGQAEIIVLCCPLTPETRHLINTNRLKLVRPDTVLINVARGGIVDEAALELALKEGRLAGLGMDTFEVEPCLENPLLKYPQVVATPHIGAQTREAGTRIGIEVERLIVDKIFKTIGSLSL